MPLRKNHVAEVREAVGGGRITMSSVVKVKWPKAALESGRKAEAIIRAAGPKGLTFAEYTGSKNRLGYLLRKCAALVDGRLSVLAGTSSG